VKLPDQYQQVQNLFGRWGWVALPFQEQAWQAFQDGKSGLVHAPTGTGKTYAVWIPPLMEWLGQQSPKPGKRAPNLTVLWVTPLRSLAQDTALALQKISSALDLPWTVEARTGDTSGSVKLRQRRHFPSCLVTTPESLSLLLSYAGTRNAFSSLTTVVVDEWHELLATKRGTMTELCLARLRNWIPNLRTWGLSATLGNLGTALSTLLGTKSQGILITANQKKKFVVETIIPKDMGKFPWSGHLGGKLVEQVARRIEKAKSTLVFTNVRSQTEYWFNALLEVRPQWQGQIGIHHGSIDKDVRLSVEERLRKGEIKAVVCTSSLDLGVDFAPVSQVLQIGGPKGVARLLQRAGRSGHQPGASSKIYCVPTQAMELVEYAAVRNSIQRMAIESRIPLQAPLDLLSQHLVTLALGEGFSKSHTLQEVRTAWSYKDLSEQDWQWTIDFITKGGKSLSAYGQFHKVVEQDGTYRVSSSNISRYHRISIGTITSDPSVLVTFRNGKKLGSVEQSFLGRVKPGQNFYFAGKLLELKRIANLTAIVSIAKSKKGILTIWSGGKAPLSSELAQAVREKFMEAGASNLDCKEMQAMKGILDLQRKHSALPKMDQLLIEKTTSQEGIHWFVFPFAGRLVHEGMAALVGYRLAKILPVTLTFSVNDYGFHICSNQDLGQEMMNWKKLLSPRDLDDELVGALNLSEMAKKQFREVARVAGLIFQGYPGAPKSSRQVQVSGNLLFDVFEKYDSGNLLLAQAKREVLERELELDRMKIKLEEIQGQELLLKQTRKFTPFAFPLWAESLRTTLSTESWGDRVRKMAQDLEASA
jgi:ATP-dependent Lhr-like helicase